MSSRLIRRPWIRMLHVRCLSALRPAAGRGRRGGRGRRPERRRRRRTGRRRRRRPRRRRARRGRRPRGAGRQTTYGSGGRLAHGGVGAGSLLGGRSRLRHNLPLDDDGEDNDGGDRGERDDKRADEASLPLLLLRPAVELLLLEARDDLLRPPRPSLLLRLEKHRASFVGVGFWNITHK